MFLGNKHHEAYWNSYRLLEGQLLRLSHSICFDDSQVNVYSSELADIINSACIKIESLAKDIYEDHIWPFQEDEDVIPTSFAGKNFKLEEWVRKKWKFDYNCLVEIDCKFALSKKQIQLKSEKFHFHKYGSTLIPFGRVSANNPLGGYWEHLDRDTWYTNPHKLQAVDWLKSYQAIKHNYIQSISEHGTVKNAIMALAAFYLLAVYHSCLPARQFDLEDRGSLQHLNFGSELFSCGLYNYTIPPCIIDNKYLKLEAERKAREVATDRLDVFKEQDLLNDIEGLPFLITLSDDVYKEVCSLVAQYCNPRNLEYFDISPYRNNSTLDFADAGAVLYINLKKYIFAPYNKNHICITFNVGSERVYDSFGVGGFDYEKSKHKNKTAVVLSELKIGDVVDATFVFDEVSHGKVVKFDEYCIDLEVDENGTHHVTSQPKANIISIRKVKN